MNRRLPSPVKVSSHWSTTGGRILQEFGLIIILVAFTVLALLFDITVPFFEKPDELKHFAVLQFIQGQNQLPVVEEGVYKPWDQEGAQPPLYHLLAALATSWLDLRDFQEPPRNPHYADERSFIWRARGNNNLYLHAVNEEWSLESVFLTARLARWLSLLAGLGTISLTYLLARIIFVDGGSRKNSVQPGESENQRLTFWRWLPLLAAALVAFIPQFLHVSSAITNDSLSVTLAAATLVMLALVIKNGGSTRYAVFLGLLLGLGALTKLSLLYLAPLTGLVLLFDLYRHRSWRRLLGQASIIGGLMLLLSGWWFWRNWRLYGEITALNAHLLYRGGPLHPRPTLAQIWQTELTGLELSFWAAFGAGQILLEPWIYTVLGWLKFLVFLGIVMGVTSGVRYLYHGLKFQVGDRQSQDTDNPTMDRRLSNGQYAVCRSQLITIVLLILWCLIIFVALLRWMQITPASWGRLLYPALPALAVLAAWGLGQFALLVPGRKKYAVRIRNIVSLLTPLILIIGLFLLSLISPFRYIQATYAKTPLISEAEIPTEEIEHLDLVYDDALRLIGYHVERPSVRPAESLPVTLYWQAVRPIEKNYSTFVHLLGHDNVVIGQANTYPDQGNWPTSLLEPGQVLKDTYYVPISPEAETPVVIRLAVGIFEFEDPQRAAKVAVNPAGESVEPIVGAVPLVPHQWPQLNPSQSKEANFFGQILLVGYDWPTETEINPGDSLPLTLYWQTLDAPGQNLNLFIHLVDATGAQVAGFDGPPAFPTVFWQPGNTIKDVRRLSLPPELPPGNYALLIGWYDLDTFARLPLMSGAADDALMLLSIPVVEADE